MAESPVAPIEPAEARNLADEVLSGRAYVEANRPPSLQERLFDWIADRFGDLLNALSSSGGRGITAWIVIIVFGLLIAYLLSRLIRQRGGSATGQAAARPIIDVIAGYSAREWLEQAEAAEAGDDWRTGLRCRHRWLAATLLGKGLISDQPSQTAGEIYRAVALHLPAAQQPMQDATNLFKDSWYGGVEADRQRRDDFVGLADHVLAIADRHAEGNDQLAESSMVPA